MYLLLVDNNYISSRDIKALFAARNIGCEVLNTSSCKSLIDLAQKVTPEFVIVDFEFFADDPISTIRELRQRTPHAYIIAFADSEYYENLGWAIEAGVSDYLIKPLQREDVLLRIKMGLHRLNATGTEADQQKTADQTSKNKVRAIIGGRADLGSAPAPESKLYNNPGKVGYIGKEREKKAVKEMDSKLTVQYGEFRDKEFLADSDEDGSPFYREIRLTPSEDLKEVYERIQKEGDGPEIDLHKIQDRLNGKELPAGALYCDTDQFRYFYKLEQLRGERSGQSVLLCMLAFSSKDYSKPPGNLLPEVMQNLKSVIMQTMRKSDLFSQWSDGQFLLLLPGLNREQAAGVLDRIERAYSRNHSTQGLLLRSKVETIFPSEVDSHFN